MDRTQPTIAATLTVRVPINATGSLADGAARVVERIDAVDRLEDATVRGIDPALNDTTVDLRVRVVFSDPARRDETDAKTELAAGVGIKAVENVEPEPAETAEPERSPATLSAVD
ncbi:hypothetical protein [Natrialba aegyptia]|uniref:Uncharacterized protein n=1 Tax=Natrialba aegyptia DSM 13077 TaxID=1227491 RepID=M0BC21_9EURY|nr:hypothetical protein [Natrialba aegyptia]ELZ07848.1 hypothetical protein C480_03304 [Natrialba aegyptia DSM 13077]